MTASDSSTVRARISEAIRQGTAVKITYVAGSGKETVRVVEPVDRDETHYWGYCRLRDDWRSFRFDRIKEMSSLPGKVTPRRIPSDLKRLPWQASAGQARPSSRRRTARRSEYAASGSGCALIMAAPLFSLFAVVFLFFL